MAVIGRERTRRARGRGKFVRAIVAALTVFGMVLAASGCSASTSSQKTLYFWNGLTGDDGPAMQKIIAAYNATNPEYRVVFQPMNGTDLTTKVYSVLQTGKNIPDLVIQDQFTMSTLEAQHALNPMDQIMKDEPNLKAGNYLPQTWNAATINGKVYGIPLYLFSEVLYYNKDLLKKYGLEHVLDDGVVTIDDIKSMKGKLPKGVYALAQQNLPWAIMSLLYSAGGNVEDGVKDMSSKPWRTAIEGLKELNEEGLIAPEDSDGEQVFGSGHSVFAILGTWSQGNMMQTLGANKVGEANTLQVSADHPANFFYEQNWVQLKDPKRSAARTRAAARFIEYVREHWMMWVQTGSLSPSVADQKSPAYRKTLQSVFTNGAKEKSYLKMSNYVYGGYATAGWQTFNDIVYGKVSLDEGLKQLDEQTQGQIQIQEQS